MNKVKINILLLLSLLFFSVLFSVLSIGTLHASASENRATIGIGYSFDYSEYVANGGILTGNACKWEDDTYESSGLRLQAGAGGEPYCLATWNASLSEGYVVYNVKATDGMCISRLRLYVTGRVFHFGHVNCKNCRMEIYAADSVAALTTPIDTIYATDSGVSTVRSWDLSEYANGAGNCFVKIKLVGAGNTWVNLERIAFEGEERYSDYPQEGVEIENKEEDILYRLPENGSIAVTPKPISVHTQEQDYSVEISYGLKNSMQMQAVDGDLTVSQPGSYRMQYSVNISDRVYSTYYDFYVVDEKYVNGFAHKEENGKWNIDALCDEKNYDAEIDTSISDVGGSVQWQGQASYVLPLEFSDRFNLIFEEPSFAESGYFIFAVTGHAGDVNFFTMEVPGLYFAGKRNASGGILLNGYFSDGNKVSLLGQQVLSNANVHGIGFCRRNDVPRTGLNIFLDGNTFASYECCYTVNTDLFMKNSTVFISFKTYECEFHVERIVESDYKSPVLKNADGTSVESQFATVGDYYTLPDVVTEDEIDGIVKHSLKITDPYGNDLSIENGQVLIEYEGRYAFLYTSTDYSGNTSSSRLRVSAQLADGAPEMLFNEMPKENGRIGVAYELPRPEVYVGGQNTNEVEVAVKVVMPSGNVDTHIYANDENAWTFVPDEIGIYRFTYSATNAVSTTTVYYEANIKLDVDSADSYENIKQSQNWQSGNSATKETDGGIKIFASSYSALPFDMRDGLEITLDLTSLGNKAPSASDYVDCWAALAIGCMPKNTQFGAYENGFIYFMFYRENTEYYLNVVAQNNDVPYGILGAYSLGATGRVVLSLDENNAKESVNLYVNNRNVDNAVLNDIPFEKLTDNENYSYLSVSVFGTSSQAPENFKALTIQNLSVCDREPPSVQFIGRWIESAELGSQVILPQVDVSDNNVEGGCRSEIAFYAPDGTQIDYRAGEFTADNEGVYCLVVKAVDKSGNTVLSVYELTVKGETVTKTGISAIGVTLIVGGVVCVLLAVVLIITVVKGKRRHKHESEK